MGHNGSTSHFLEKEISVELVNIKNIGSILELGRLCKKVLFVCFYNAVVHSYLQKDNNTNTTICNAQYNIKLITLKAAVQCSKKTRTRTSASSNSTYVTVT